MSHSAVHKGNGAAAHSCKTLQEIADGGDRARGRKENEKQALKAPGLMLRSRRSGWMRKTGKISMFKTTELVAWGLKILCMDDITTFELYYTE